MCESWSSTLQPQFKDLSEVLLSSHTASFDSAIESVDAAGLSPNCQSILRNFADSSLPRPAPWTGLLRPRRPHGRSGRLGQSAAEYNLSCRKLVSRGVSQCFKSIKRFSTESCFGLGAAIIDSAMDAREAGPPALG